jgi:hypothetical protein
LEANTSLEEIVRCNVIMISFYEFFIGGMLQHCISEYLKKKIF